MHAAKTPLSTARSATPVANLSRSAQRASDPRLNATWAQLSLGRAGGPLPQDAREFFEPRFGQDFSSVRVHTDAVAAENAAAISARAFTHGRDVYFGRGEFAPETKHGRTLIAHELTHVVQQGKAGGGDHIARATYKIGDAKVNVDYGNVIFHDKVVEYQGEIEQRFTAFTGQPAAGIHAAVAALTAKQMRWVLYAIDLLTDNPLPALGKALAVQRLIEYAPSAIHAPLDGNNAPGHILDFESEALRASGWFEFALTDKLKDPDADTQQKKLDPLYNPGGAATGSAASSACPATRATSAQLNEAKLKTDLDALVRGFVSGEAAAAAAISTSSHSLPDVKSLADVVQGEALSFFAPEIGRSHTRSFQQTWQYSAHIIDSTAPGAIPAPARRAFLDNRARKKAGETGLLDAVHYDPRCDADDTVFDDIINKIDADPAVQADLNTVLSWQTFTKHNDVGADVTVNLQHRKSDDPCEARWAMVETLCHELMHVYVSQDFFEMHKNRQLITEGFTEILGDQLYDHIRSVAMSDHNYRKTFEAGLSTGACIGVKIPWSTRSYTPASDRADTIRKTVGDANFRAAYFLGRNTLAGLQPKLRIGGQDSPDEREADAVADRIANSENATSIPVAAMPT